MYSGKIKSIKKDVHIETGEQFLDVEIEIFDDKGKAVATRKIAFPVDEKPKKIKEEVRKYIKVFADERKMFEKNKKNDELNKLADKTIKDLEGLSINV